jgi:D-glycero-D-manno-heptose 1,7-bisphosphate phosphatase
MSNGALFLDRDGVLNELVERQGRLVSPRRLSDFRIVDGAIEAIWRVRDLGVPRFVVTNQPDIARGLMPLSELDAMHALLRRSMPITDIAYCPHDEGDACNCRKPKPGLVLTLAEQWRVSLQQSVLIGDAARDMSAGRTAGCFNILLGDSETDASAADCRAATLHEAFAIAIARLMH